MKGPEAIFWGLFCLVTGFVWLRILRQPASEETKAALWVLCPTWFFIQSAAAFLTLPQNPVTDSIVTVLKYGSWLTLGVFLLSLLRSMVVHRRTVRG